MTSARRAHVGRQGIAARAIAEDLARGLERVRRRTLALVAPLPEEVLARPVCGFMSPLLWDLGHIADFERLWLVDAVEGRSDARLEARFDALNTPRGARADLQLPDRAAALAALARVRADALALLPVAGLDGGDPLLRDGYVYRMVMQHEIQHQETMLQALDLAAHGWGYPPAGSEAGAGDAGDLESSALGSGALESSALEHGAPARGDLDPGGAAAAIDDTARIEIRAGAFDMGTEDRAHAYDNERPRHRVRLAGFAIERYPVSNRRWCDFIDDGGYRRAELWSPAGREWLAASGAACPQGWRRTADGWQVTRFGRRRRLAPWQPVQHTCFWEAEAFARWCGGRLPSEAEWEKAAAWDAPAGVSRPLPRGRQPAADDAELVALESAPDTAAWGPPRLGARPAEASAYGVEDLHGAVYQWTSSPLAPYPGFEAFPYRGYSEVFFGDTYRVLRGSSWAADAPLRRNTYRNWDLPQRRQIFAGARLVYDA